MTNFHLQFQGTHDTVLACALLGLVTVLLAGWGVWQWRAGYRLAARISWAAALTAPVFAAVMLVEASLRHRRGDVRGGRLAWLAAVLAAGALTVVAGIVASVGVSWPAVLAGLLAVQVFLAVGVLYSGAYESLGLGRLAGLIALRSAAILMLLGVLTRPAVSVEPTDTALRPPLAVLVDRSGSMAVAEPPLGERYARSVQMLASQQGRLAARYRSVWASFAQSPERAASVDELAGRQPRGEGTDQTNIAAAIRSVGRVGGAAPAAIVLITDGNDTSGEDITAAAEQTGAVVYALGVGDVAESQTAHKNIELTGVDAPLVATADEVATITATLKVSGLANHRSKVVLADAETGKELAGQSAWIAKPTQSQQVLLPWTARRSDTTPGDPPTATQVARLTVSAEAAAGEANDEDNRTDLHVLITHPKIRVLYVEGAIRPEYKYLQRQMAGDANIELMTLVRVGDSRFWARGSVGGKTLSALPAGRSEFDWFDVIVLGDLDSHFLTDEQMRELAAFVERGGGLLMLGGQHSLGPGGYGGTDVEKALPVLVGGRDQPQATAPLRLRLTATGRAHPILSNIADTFADSADTLPPLRGCVTVVSAKPQAAVLAAHPTRENAAGPLVVLAVMRYGSGRSAVLTADTTWQWYLPMRSQGEASPYHRFWAQLTRWLAGVEGRTRRQTPAVVARLPRTYVPAGQKLDVSAAAVGGERADQTDIRATCELVRQGSAEATVSAAMRPLEGGTFRAELDSPEAGEYRLVVRATDSAGRSLGEDALSVHIAQPPAETQRLARNEALLRRLAEQTDGRYGDLAALPDILDALDAEILPSYPQPAATITPLHHFPTLMALFVAALTCEWVLRRRWQLR
ncbi:MAG: glutamine amidotransferase [Planctomycetota bacterium]|jgi:uncharacterized membrane protein